MKIEKITTHTFDYYLLDIVYIEYDGGGMAYEFEVWKKEYPLGEVVSVYKSNGGYGSQKSATDAGFRWIKERL